MNTQLEIDGLGLRQTFQEKSCMENSYEKDYNRKKTETKAQAEDSDSGWQTNWSRHMTLSRGQGLWLQLQKVAGIITDRSGGKKVTEQAEDFDSGWQTTWSGRMTLRSKVVIATPEDCRHCHTQERRCMMLKSKVVTTTPEGCRHCHRQGMGRQGLRLKRLELRRHSIDSQTWNKRRKQSVHSS